MKRTRDWCCMGNVRKRVARQRMVGKKNRLTLLHTAGPYNVVIERSRAETLWSRVDVFRNRVRLVKRCRASSAPTLQMIPLSLFRHRIGICMERQSENAPTSGTRAPQRLGHLSFETLSLSTLPAVGMNTIASTIMPLPRK